jgi:hypothetical protein
MRRNRARAERVSIDRSAVQTCLHGYELHDSTSSSRSKQSGMLPSSAGRQMGKAPQFLILNQLLDPKKPATLKVSTPPQGPYSRSRLAMPAGVSISRRNIDQVKSSCSGSGETSLPRTVSMRVWNVVESRGVRGRGRAEISYGI